jgi:hypothetical protein
VAQTFIPIRLLHPVADRLCRWFKLLCQLFWTSVGTNKLDHLSPEFWWIWRM